MAIARIGNTAGGANKTAQTGQPAALTTAATVGNTLIGVVSGDAAVTSVTDPRGNTWQVDATKANSTFVTVSVISVYMANAYAVNDVITINFASSSKIALIIDEYSGVESAAGSARLDGTPVGTSSNTGIPSNTLAISIATTLLIGAIATNGPAGDSFTNDTTNGWTNNLGNTGTTGGSQTSNISIRSGWKLPAATGSFTYAPTLTARNWAELVVGYRAAVISPPMQPIRVLGQARNRAALY